jgi:hypothetical protein
MNIIKLTVHFLTISILFSGLIGCGGVSQNDYDLLRAENKKLNEEIESLKFGPDLLLSQAELYLDAKEFSSAKSELQTLLEKHPGSQHVTKSKQLIAIADKGIEELRIAEEKARIEKEKLEEERLTNATKKLITKYDDIKGITWYYDKGTPQYNNYNSFHLYMGKEKTGYPWLRVKIQYTSDDWLFIKSYNIKTDSNSYIISTSYGEVEKDNGSGDIWEWYDVPLDNRLFNIVKDVIKSKTVKLRHNGKQYYKDRTISEKEKQGLQNILDAYEALGGTMIFL